MDRNADGRRPLMATPGGRCGACGYQYDPEDRYCRHCGGRLFLYLDERPEAERDQVILAIEKLIDQFLAKASDDRSKGGSQDDRTDHRNDL